MAQAQVRRPRRRRAGSARVAPPKAQARTPISEIPICTVERNRVGPSASSIAVRAPRSPASARCPRRALREETKAVSDMAKRPLRRVSATMIAIWKARLIILGYVCSPGVPLVTSGEKEAAVQERSRTPT
jgi:hypothetical protein